MAPASTAAAAPRTCAHCSGPLPAGADPQRLYCTRHCQAAARYRRICADPVRLEARRADAGTRYRKYYSTAEGRKRYADSHARYIARLRTDPDAWEVHQAKVRARRHHLHQERTAKRRAERVCQECAGPIPHDKHLKTRYCGRRCYYSARNRFARSARAAASAGRSSRPCAQCGQILGDAARGPHPRHRYCSDDCRRAAKHRPRRATSA